MTGGRRRERGFSLPELLVGSAILLIIGGAIATALLVTVGTDDQAAARLRASNSAQLASLYLPTDVQSAGDEAADADTDPAAIFSCQPAGDSTVNVLTLRQAASGFEVAYRLDGDELIRFACVAGAAEAIVVARGVVAASVEPDPPTGGQLILLLTIQPDPDEPAFDIAIAGTPRLRDGDLATPTTAPTSSTSSTSSSSTSTSSTTSTTAACVTTVSANPASVARDSNNHKLLADVVITVTRSAACTGAAPTEIRYPILTGQGVGSRSLQGGSGTWTATIAKNDERFGPGSMSVEVRAGSSSLGTFSGVFTVTG